MLYKENAGYKHLTWKYFIAWIILSIYHSFVIYFVGYAIWNGNSAIYNNNKPYTSDLYSFGTFMIQNVVMVVNLKLILIAKNQTFIFLLSIFVSIASFIISTFIYNFIYVWDKNMYYVYKNLISSPTLWISTILIIISALLPDYAIMSLKIFEIKFRPAASIANGWSQVFNKKQRKTFRRNSNVNSISESTYL